MFAMSKARSDELMQQSERHFARRQFREPVFVSYRLRLPRRPFLYPFPFPFSCRFPPPLRRAPAPTASCADRSGILRDQAAT